MTSAMMEMKFTRTWGRMLSTAGQLVVLARRSSVRLRDAPELAEAGAKLIDDATAATEAGPGVAPT